MIMALDNILGISGQMAGVNLSSFLQMIEMEQKTCTIKVLTKKNMGRIFFFKGVLVDADTVRLQQLNALYDILSWQNIVIEVEKNVSRKEDAIKLPLMHILIESARLIDEQQRQNSSGDSDDDLSGSSRNIPLQKLKDTPFSLEIGCRLLIDFDDLAVSFRSALVGIEHGKYLLIKSPSPFGKIDHDQFKVKDMIIKSLYKGTIYAFRSRLMSVISEPSELMFIAYPKKIEHHELRSHKRFKCSIVAQAQVNDQERGAVIENISKGGCLCVIEALAREDNPAGLLNNTIPFRCHFPGSKGEIRFLGEIKNSRKKTDEIVVGLKFVNPDDEDTVQDIINNYIRLIEYSSENV